MTAPLPYAYFPNLVDLVFDCADPHALLQLRTVCRAFRDKADALLARHLVLRENWISPYGLPGRHPVFKTQLPSDASEEQQALMFKTIKHCRVMEADGRLMWPVWEYLCFLFEGGDFVLPVLRARFRPYEDPMSSCNSVVDLPVRCVVIRPLVEEVDIPHPDSYVIGGVEDPSTFPLPVGALEPNVQVCDHPRKLVVHFTAAQWDQWTSWLWYLEQWLESDSGESVDIVVILSGSEAELSEETDRDASTIAVDEHPVQDGEDTYQFEVEANPFFPWVAGLSPPKVGAFQKPEIQRWTFVNTSAWSSEWQRYVQKTARTLPGVRCFPTLEDYMADVGPAQFALEMDG